jgi:hypothetical protein
VATGLVDGPEVIQVDQQHGQVAVLIGIGRDRVESIAKGRPGESTGQPVVVGGVPGPIEHPAQLASHPPAGQE